MDWQRLPSASFTKNITNYSTTVKQGYITWFDVFSVGKSRWKIGISRARLYLSDAENDDELPKGWYRDTYFRFILHQLIPPHRSPRILETRMEFTHETRLYGFPYGTLSELQDEYLVNDTMDVQVSMIVLRAFPMTMDDDQCIGVDKFKKDVSRLARYLEMVEPDSTKVKVAAREVPSLKEVKKARQSLKECLLSPYEPNAPDELTAALKTLKLKEGETELIRYSLKEYMEDYWMLQKADSEWKAWSLKKAWKFFGLKRCYFENIELERELDSLTREGKWLKERKERIKQASKQKNKSKEEEEEHLLEFKKVEDSKMEILLRLEMSLARAERWWSGYCFAVEKAAKAEKEKGAAEERFSTSTIAWRSNIKSLLDRFA